LGADYHLPSLAREDLPPAVRCFQTESQPHHRRKARYPGKGLAQALGVMNQRSTHSARVAVVGGGLAGLAAGSVLAHSGFHVTLFERRPYLGGRASSYEHPGTGEIVDNCQHVLFRVCTNLVEFYRRIGVDQQIRWYDEMTFIEPGGRASVMHASPLPAPLHTMPSFLRFPFLDATDKLAIARAMIPLTLTTQPDTGDSFAQWLQRHG